MFRWLPGGGDPRLVVADSGLLRWFQCLATGYGSGKESALCGFFRGVGVWVGVFFENSTACRCEIIRVSGFEWFEPFFRLVHSCPVLVGGGAAGID